VFSLFAIGLPAAVRDHIADHGLEHAPQLTLGPHVPPGSPSPLRRMLPTISQKIIGNAKSGREVTMSNVEQFEKVVTEAGAVAMRIMRGPRGAERLVIQTRGGLITREVPLRGDLDKDIQAATTSAREIVASAKSLTANPARNLSAPAITERSSENLVPSVSRAQRRP
jgi:hypothetical protein